jgi:hypothetical protein
MRHHDPQKAIRLAHMIAKHLMRGGYADGGDPTPDDDADYAAAVAAGQNADLSGATPLTIYGNKPDTSRATVEGADMPPQPAGGNDVVDRALKASAQSMSPAQLAKLWTSPEEYGAESPDWSPLAKDVGSKFMEYTAPRMEDFERGSMGPSQLVQQGIENMRSGEPWRMLAGAGQDVLGTVSQPFAPIAGAMEAAKGSAERTFGPAAGQAVDVASNLNPDFLPTALAKAAHYSPELAMAGMGMKAANPAVDLAKSVTDASRVTNDVGLYSHGAEAAAALPQAKGTPDQFKAMLQKAGVKPAEFENSGYDQAFAGQPSITRDQVVQHFQDALPNVNETVLGGKQPFDANRLSELEKEYAGLKEHPIDAPSFGEDKYNEMIRLMNIRDQSSTQSLYDAADRAMAQAQRAQARGDRATAEKYFRENELLNTRAEKLDLQGEGLANPTKFQQYTLPGGENYREVLLKTPTPMSQYNSYVDELRGKYGPGGFDNLPLSDAERNKLDKLMNAAGDEGTGGTFRSSHWSDPNVLAHLRMSDRVGDSGEKVLHLEELQSDWGQKGRKEGFLDNNAINDYNEHMNKLKEAENRTKELMQIASKRLNIANPQYKDAVSVVPELKNASDEQSRLYYSIPEKPTGLVSAPYVTKTNDWTDLALKRALKEAAEGGYDKMVWTPGAEQAKRYDLSKQISRIEFYDNHSGGIGKPRMEGDPGSGTIHAYDKDGREVINKYVDKASDIEGIVGKEVAQKLFASRPVEHREAGVGLRKRALEGQDLSVGGEGMKSYYDKIVPGRLKELTKKLDPDAKIEPHVIRTPKGDIPAQSIRITPQMRERILKGLPAFKRGGFIIDRALNLTRGHQR